MTYSINVSDITFGGELRRARKSRGRIQAYLGSHVGVSPALVSQWENNHAVPDANEVFGMEDALGLAPGTLSTHLGYVPLDEKTRLGLDLVGFFGGDRGRQLLKRLAEHHHPDDDLVAWALSV
jgi:transcriptional regulator with XRE-family HTH domain